MRSMGRVVWAVLAACALCPTMAHSQEEGYAERVWGRVEYLLWWRKPVCLKPPILTTGDTGVLGQPGTRVVLGQTKFEFSGTSGVRPTLGAWLLDDELLGVEAAGLFLLQGENKRSYRTTNGGPATYLSFQDPQNTQQALPFSVPGVVDGASFARGTSRLTGFETSFLTRITGRRDEVELGAALVVGYRYLALTDRVEVTQTQSLVANPAVSATGSATFTTHNYFNGAQVGCRLTAAFANWSLEYRSSLAVGETHLVSQVSGSPLTSGQPIAGLVPGPLLALPSNVGEYKTTRISLVPEVSLTARCQVLDWLAVTLGYNVLYWNKVLCPGDQMDPHVNLTQLPGRGPVTGRLAPEAPIVFTDFFAQGLTAGVELRY